MIAAVVLAAGAASRFGAPKQELLLPGVLERVGASSVQRVSSCSARIPSTWPASGGSMPRLGARSGGVAALRPRGARPEVEAVAVCLADGPLLSPRAIDRVVDAWRGGAGELLAASYGGVRGHPVVIGRSAWADIPDDGGRSLRPVLVPCDDLGAPGDVDVPDDLEALREGGVGSDP